MALGLNRWQRESIAGKIIKLMATFPLFLTIFMLFGLVFRSRRLIFSRPLTEILFSTAWAPLRGNFGLWPFIMGTIWVTAIAIFLAAPLSLLVAIYLSEYAPVKWREAAKPIIDLLAGLPSVIYGVWGVLVIVPFVGRVVAPAMKSVSNGYSVLAGGIVLAVMIFPTIVHVIVEVFRAIPAGMREASLSLGATKWETVKYVLLRQGAPGILAAHVLGVSRALGETMAVLMVVGNVAKVPRSFFSGGYPLPALIANNYGEMMSIPLYDSALMLAAVILFCLVLGFNVMARLILVWMETRLG